MKGMGLVTFSFPRIKSWLGRRIPICVKVPAVIYGIPVQKCTLQMPVINPPHNQILFQFTAECNYHRGVPIDHAGSGVALAVRALILILNLGPLTQASFNDPLNDVDGEIIIFPLKDFTTLINTITDHVICVLCFISKCSPVQPQTCANSFALYRLLL